MITAEDFLHQHPVSLPSQSLPHQSEGVEETEIYDQCFRSAVQSLTSAGASTKMLIDRLYRKHYPHEVITRVIHRLEDDGYLNDYEYAESACRKMIKKNFGPFRIQYELTQKGIDASCIRSLLQQAEDRGDFDTVAQAIAHDVYQKNQSLDLYHLHIKVARIAQQKGIDVSTVLSYISKYEQ